MSSRAIACQECGNAINDTRKAERRFCGPKCRMAYNNRRRDRGADVYDLLRAHRRERDLSKQLNLWTEICRLELKWQQEDEEQRPGRRSYTPPKEALANLYDKGSLQRGDTLVNSYLSGRSGGR